MRRFIKNVVILLIKQTLYEYEIQTRSKIKFEK